MNEQIGYYSEPTKKSKKIAIFLLFLVIYTAYLFIQPTNYSYSKVLENKKLYTFKLPMQSLQPNFNIPPKSSSTINDDINKLDDSINQMQQILARRQALNELRMQVHKSAAGEELEQDKARDLLLRAGFRPPPKVILNKNTNELAYNDEDSQFAKSVAREVVKDEVASFFQKIKILSKVGAFVVNKFRDEQ